MKLVLDNIVFSLQRFGGISTYWYELIKRVLENGATDAYFMTGPNKNILDVALKMRESRVIATRKNNPIIFERFINPSLSSISTPFIFHSSYNRYCRNINALNVCTVHDFIPEIFYKGLRKKIHNFQKTNVIRNSDAIITVSKNTRNDLLRFLPDVNPNKIHVVYNGVSDLFYKIEESSYKYQLNESIIDTRYLLFISSRDAYKNFDFTVKLLEKLPDFRLYIVGKPLDSKEFSLLNSRLSGRWKLFSSLNIVSLNELYNHAYALIYPSSYEGFGIPILEAMRAGTPFVALNKSSIPEVAGPGGILLDELDLNTFKEAVLSIDSNRDSIIQKGYSQIENFSWEKCYQETIKVYSDLYNS